MKVGTFVAKENIDVTPEEQSVNVDRFKSAIKKYFPQVKAEYFTYKSETVKSLTVTFKDVVPNGKFRVHSSADNRFIRPKDLVYPTGYISIILYSEMGYDEAEVGRSYEWKSMGHPDGWSPELNKHGYALYLLWHGEHKAYRRQIKSGLEVTNHFFYGTELSDLDFENSLKTIADISNSWTAER